MGTSATVDELTVTPGLTAAVEVDSDGLRSAAGAGGRLAGHLHHQHHALAQISGRLWASTQLPGMAFTALPARGAIESVMNAIRLIITDVEDLSDALVRAAVNYEDAEGWARRLLAGAQEGASGWREMYGTWWPTPLQTVMAPVSRFYTAAANANIEALTKTPRSSFSSYRQALGHLLAAGPIRHSQIAALSPTGWIGHFRNLAETTMVVPKALRPLWDGQHPGIDRAEGARLARGLSGTLVPGGGVSAGAGVLTRVVGLTHWGLGHERIRLERLPPTTPAPVTPVRTFEGAIGVMEELAVDEETRPGSLRIDKITSGQSEVSWQVFIPGGQGFDPGNVHSLLHAVSAVDSRPTPSVAMIAEALREVGAGKGEPIMMVGHSHGGITGSMFANNPRLRAEFDVPLVLAAGSPVDLHEIRPDTHVVSLEHTEDPITGLEGIQRRLEPGLTRVERTLGDSADPAIAGGSGIFHSHDYPNYIGTARLADEHPDLQHLKDYMGVIIPDGRVETYTFRGEITR